MIRNVVLGRLRDAPDAAAREHDLGELDAGLAGIAALALPGQLDMHAARDAGLREGNWTFAITNDWADAAAYRAYDVDAEHNRYRTRIAAVCAEIARAQIEIG